jgi:hypothetical protein
MAFHGLMANVFAWNEGIMFALIMTDAPGVLW